MKTFAKVIKIPKNITCGSPEISSLDDLWLRFFFSWPDRRRPGKLAAIGFEMLQNGVFGTAAGDFGGDLRIYEKMILVLVRSAPKIHASAARKTRDRVPKSRSSPLRKQLANSESCWPPNLITQINSSAEAGTGRTFHDQTLLSSIESEMLSITWNKIAHTFTRT